MLRKFISVLCVFLGISAAAYAGPAANIEYIHNAVREKWGVELTTTANPRMVANMEYLLAAVDVVNEYLNGYPVHRPEWKKYATHQVADTIATDFAVSELIGLEWPFEITTTEISSGDTFEYMLGAAGEFMVDWGDGTVEKIDRNTTELGMYSHTYETAGTYKIKFRGHATGYEIIDIETAGMWSAIVFEGNYMIASISGSLGSIFGTLPDGTNPTFLFTFAGCKNLTSIPETLFAGISGAPTVAMFLATFDGCIGLTSIPENLFAGISGTPAAYMFDSTFYGCSGLTSIPNNIFAKISGVPAERVFAGTFSGCIGLTSIPENLFAGISGAPAYGMFGDTFYGCTGLTSIPENLFGDISGPAVPDMFAYMFDGCTGLTGPSAKIGGKYLYEIWPDATAEQVGKMYSGCNNLDDYCKMPNVWGGPEVPGCGEWDLMLNLQFPNWQIKDLSIKITAYGTFYINWGDGSNVLVVTEPGVYRSGFGGRDSTNTNYVVKIAGRATDYSSNNSAAIQIYHSYVYAPTLNRVTGSLSKIFPTLPDGSNPNFRGLFGDLKIGVERFPDTLFAGLYGQATDYMFADALSGAGGSVRYYGSVFKNVDLKPAPYMFSGTFAKLGGMFEGAGLFSGVKGAPTPYLFSNTFSSNPQGYVSIPAGLFATIQGAPAEGMFSNTFNGWGANSISTIPDDLFAGISGAPAKNMFKGTFSGWLRLKEIPENLFRNISGPAMDGMFVNTFYNAGLAISGPSAKIGGRYLYEIWPDATAAQVGGCYGGGYSPPTGLTDYADIPAVWK